MTNYQSYQKFAESLVTSAGEIIREHFLSRRFSTEWKTDHTYVTQTDTQAETLMRELISNQYPDHAILGEEYGGSIDSHTPTWILDPLDGTTNFSHHIPLFCSMASLHMDNQVVAAAVYAPINQLLFSASLGAGASINQTPFPTPATTTKFENVTILLDSGKTAEAKKCANEFVATEMHAFRSYRRFGCMIAPLLLASEGKLDISIIFGVDLYDVAALSLLMREASYLILGNDGQTWQKTLNGDLTIVSPSLLTQTQTLLTRFYSKRESA